MKTTKAKQISELKLKTKELDLNLFMAQEENDRLRRHFGVTKETKLMSCSVCGGPLRYYSKFAGMHFCSDCVVDRYMDLLHLIKEMPGGKWRETVRDRAVPKKVPKKKPDEK